MKWLSVVFFLAIAAIIVAAVRDRLPQFIHVLYAFAGGDKVGHFMLMGMLTFLVNLALPLWPADKPWRSLLIGSITIAIAVSIEEASQGFLRTRTPSWADLISSYAGI